MNLANVMRRTHAHLGATACVYNWVDEHRLAQCARAQELASGSIIAPHATARSSYLPYHAARPVAAHTAGLRRAGFLASASWGASLAVGAMRTDVPLLSLYWFAFHRNLRPAPAPTQRGSGDRQGRAELAKTVLKALPYAAFALAGWEAALGTGQLPAQAGAAEADARVAADRWRRIGAAGRLEATLLAAANNAAADGRVKRELGCLSLALGVRLALVPPRLAGALFVGSVALFGAAFGVSAEAVAQLVFYGYLAGCRLRGRAAEVVAMQDAIARQYAPWAERLRQLDDTALGAPFVEALWRLAPDEALEADNVWTSVGAAASCLHRHVRMQQLGLLPQADELARAGRALQALARAAGLGGADAEAFGRGGDAPGGGVPPPRGAEARRYAAGVDVHERGRDPAMRRSLAHLSARYPDIDEAGCVVALREELARQRRTDTPLARRAHEGGGRLLDAAELALDPELRPRFAGFAAVLADNHDVRLDDGRRVSLRRVCALVWHAIGQLEDPRGTPAHDETLRQERKDALLVALADCITGHQSRVCGPGQAQRMLLVLQGCVDGVQIENYEEAPTVAQLETYLYRQIAADLPEVPTRAQVQARYDAAYRQGCARLPQAQHAQLRAGLARLVELDHDFAWAPVA